MATRHERLRYGPAPILLLAAVTLAGCDAALPLDNSGPPAVRESSSGQFQLTSADGALPAFPEPRDSIPRVRIDLPRTARAFDSSDEALVEAVRQAQGRVFIGFRQPGTERSLTSGWVGGLRRTDVVAAREDLESRGVEIIRTYRNQATVVARLDPSMAPSLRQLPTVDYIEPVQSGQGFAVSALPTRRNPSSTPDLRRDARFHEYPVQDTSWGAWKVRAPAAWSVNAGGQAFLTFIDYGVDQDHHYATAGDLHFSSSYCLYVTPLTSCFDVQNDGDGHGSHVVGIAGADNNDYGWTGVAHTPRDMASVKACHRYFQDQCGEDMVVTAIEWARDNGQARQIVNLSLGYVQYSQTLATAIAQLYNSGALIIAAAGNTPSSSVAYPAALSQVIAVSGTLQDDSFAGNHSCQATFPGTYSIGSVAGPEVELAAPFWATSAWSHLRYNTFCGTSMASPVVVGVAALIWTKWPSWSNAAVRGRLSTTAIDLPPTGRDNQFGNGRVDAYNALFDFYVTLSGQTNIIFPGTYFWSGSVSPSNGGDGSYTYLWEKSSNQTNWSTVGTAPSYSQYVGEFTPDFYLRVTVTSAGFQRSDTKLIRYVGECNPMC